MGRIIGAIVPFLLIALLLVGDVTVAFGGVGQDDAIGIRDETDHDARGESVGQPRVFLPLILGSWMAPGPTATSTPTGTATETPTPTPTATYVAPSGCRIAYLQYEGPDEYVRIRNFGDYPQDMTGWQIHSVIGDQWYMFPPGYLLDPDAWVRVHSGPDAQADPPADLLWTTAYVWNNEGDEARLMNSHGQEVDSWAY